MHYPADYAFISVQLPGPWYVQLCPVATNSAIVILIILMTLADAVDSQYWQCETIWHGERAWPAREPISDRRLHSLRALLCMISMPQGSFACKLTSLGLGSSFQPSPQKVPAGTIYRRRNHHLGSHCDLIQPCSQLWRSRCVPCSSWRFRSWPLPGPRHVSHALLQP